MCSERLVTSLSGGWRTAMVREMHVVELLASMELAGLPLLPERLTVHCQAVEQRLKELAALAEQQLRGPINLASAQQVSEALHVTLGLPKPSGADAAARATHGSVNEAHLQELVTR